MSGQYITQNRMKRVRWEEAEMNARLKRDYPGQKVVIDHRTCSCGSMQCTAVPGPKHIRDNVPLVEVPAAQAERILSRRKVRPKKSQCQSKAKSKR